MATGNDSFNSRTDDPHLSQFLDNLSIDDQRVLSRLLNSWEKRDQRRQPRIPCSVITEYSANDLDYKGIMRNISLDGAFIESQHELAVSQRIAQSFFFPNFEIPIRSNSKIVWVATEGFGVQFEFVQNQK
ncbi:MAG: PilZ domain-containing protein [Deltaproteobacteria bacterium]|nr:PilZ domain-containing protein [Deltaproteobacteria bacterium]